MKAIHLHPFVELIKPALAVVLLGSASCSAVEPVTPVEATQTPPPTSTHVPTETPLPTATPTETPPTAEDFNKEIEKHRTEIKKKYDVDVSVIELRPDTKDFYAIDNYGVARFKWNGKEWVEYKRPTAVSLQAEYLRAQEYIPGPEYKFQDEKHLSIDGVPLKSGHLLMAHGADYVSCIVTDTPTRYPDDLDIINLPCKVSGKYSDNMLVFGFVRSENMVNLVSQPMSGELTQENFGLNLKALQDGGEYSGGELFGKGVKGFFDGRSLDDALNNPGIVGRQIIVGINPPRPENREEYSKLITAIKKDIPLGIEIFEGWAITISIPEDYLPEWARNKR